MLAGTGLLVISCKSGPSGGEGSGGGQQGFARVAWPFWPASMRIHPATRLGADAVTGEPIIELRLQFRDSWDDLIKAIGNVSIDFYGSAEPTGDPPLRHWVADLTDLDYNAERFDDVTWTYLLNLRLQGLDPPQDNHLSVRFDSANGSTLTNTAPLRVPHE